jgi:hypothetical protein
MADQSVIELSAAHASNGGAGPASHDLLSINGPMPSSSTHHPREVNMLEIIR